MFESQQNPHLNVPIYHGGGNRTTANVTVKINTYNESASNITNPNSPNACASTPPISSFIPKFQSV